MPTPIPQVITEDWLNDMRRRVLAGTDIPSAEELRAAREHIRMKHVAAGLVSSRSKTKDNDIAEVAGNTSLSDW